MVKVCKLSGCSNICKLLREYASEFRSLSNNPQLIEQLSGKFSRCGNVLIVKENVSILGFAAFYCNDYVNRVAYLSLIAVDSKYQKMGFGKILLDAVVEYCMAQGMTQLKLEVKRDNTKAIEFYKKNDFNYELAASLNSVYMVREI